MHTRLLTAGRILIFTLALTASTLYAPHQAHATTLGNQQIISLPIDANNTQTQALLWLPDTYATDSPTATYPLIINLHGAGDAGTDINYLLNPALLSRRIADGFKPEAVNPIDGQRYKFIVVSPQAPSWSYSYTNIKAMLPALLANYRINIDRIYITGLSAGGQGSWTAITDDPTNSINISAIAPMSAATLDASQVPNVVNAATNNIGVWSLMGSLDWFLSSTTDYTNRVNAASPATPAKLTIINGVGHSSWIEGFDDLWRVNGMNVFEWMLTNKRGTPNPTNVLPTVSLTAPSDKAVIVAPQSITLTATAADADGSVAKVEFFNGNTLLSTATASPYTYTWANPGVGTYAIFARVTDNTGAVSNSNTARITVLAQSNVSAPFGGTPRAIPGTIQAEDYDIGGEGIAYHDTTPENTGNWYRPYEGVDVEIATSEPGGNQYYLGWPSTGEWMNYTVNVAQSGTYALQVRTATPNTGESFRVDVDGTAVATVAVPQTADLNTYLTSTVANIALTAGQHVLKIYDNTSNFNINWMSFALSNNQLPTVNAGADQAITQPASSVTLSGAASDPDGTIASYAWTEVSGPNTATIVSPASATTTVNGLIAGAYTFRLTVTDNGGATAFDDVAVTVTGISTPYTGGPYAIPGRIEAENFDNGGQGVAYNDTTSTNTGFAYRTAEGVDIETTPDGTYDVGWTVGGEWMQYSVSVAQSGTYTLQARIATPNTGDAFTVAMDGTTIATVTVPSTGGWQAWQTIAVPNVPVTAGQHYMRITILNAADVNAGFNINWFNFVNVPPTSNAGVDQTITLPASTVSLTGSGTDTDGTIATYAWSKISGSGTITTPGAASTTVTGLTQGTSVFRLTVTDNLGAQATDDIQITVNAAVPSQTPYGGTAWAIPGTIEGENFDNGGQNLAYYDSTSGNTGGAYRTTESVDIGTGDGGYILGWTTAGEWTTYTVNVAKAGTYTLNIRASTVSTNKSLRVDMDGATLATVVITKTNSLNTYKTTSKTGIALTAGQHIMKVYNVTDGINFNWISFAATNYYPIANAGADQSIQSTTATLAGTATDTDGTIATYAWSKVSGGAVTITTPAAATTTVTGLTTGTYVFRLTATDNVGGVGTDDVQVTVAVSNVPPQITVGGVTSMTLTDTATDSDGTIVSYAWTQVSGPSATIVSPSSATTVIDGLSSGVYIFRAVATDNQGATVTNNFQVTVN